MTLTFRGFYHDYIDRIVTEWSGEDSLSLAFLSICDYYRYCEASLRTYNELYGRWLSVLGEHRHDQQLDDQFVAAAFWVYSNGSVCLDYLRGVNALPDQNDVEFVSFREEFRTKIANFQHCRDKIVAHPHNMPLGIIALPKSVVTSGSYWTWGISFRTVRLNQSANEPHHSIHANPSVDIRIIRDYVNGVVPFYRRFFLTTPLRRT